MTVLPKAVLAFVLHRRAVGETSMLVTFLTREKGLLRARVRGGRTQSKQGVLEPFVPLWLSLDERASTSYVREVQVQAYWGALPHISVIPGLYLNELLYRFLHPEEDSDLFLLYQNAIQCLMTAQSQGDVESILRRFEWHLLEISGRLVSFTHEAYQDCPIARDQYYQLHPTVGFIRSSMGFLGEEILGMAQGAWEDRAVLKTAKRVMRSLIVEALEGEPIHARALYVGRP